MRMRAVIEAARAAAPLISGGMAAQEERLQKCQQLIEDMAGVKSDAARAAIAVQCANYIAGLHKDLLATEAAWRGLESALSRYKYRFKKPNGKVSASDLPGQMVLSGIA